jgi:hypothetical protein
MKLFYILLTMSVMTLTLSSCNCYYQRCVQPRCYPPAKSSDCPCPHWCGPQPINFYDPLDYKLDNSAL